MSPTIVCHHPRIHLFAKRIIDSAQTTVYLQLRFRRYHFPIGYVTQNIEKLITKSRKKTKSLKYEIKCIEIHRHWIDQNKNKILKLITKTKIHKNGGLLVVV